MRDSKDNSNIYALVVTILIVIVIFAKKFNVTEMSSSDNENSIVGESPDFVVNDIDSDTVSLTENPSKYLYEFEGMYASTSGFLKDPTVLERLSTLIGAVRLDQIRRHWDIESKITIENDILVADGCQSNNCDVTSFTIIIDLINDIIYAGIKIEGNTEVFSETGSSIGPLEKWRAKNDPQFNIIEINSESRDFTSLINYYNDITNDDFDAKKYFASNVSNYITLTDVTPFIINDSYRSDSKEYTKQIFVYDPDSFEELYTSDGVVFYSFLLNYKCYRASKKSNEKSEIRVEVGFNNLRQIVSLKYPKIESTIYSNY